MNKKKRIALYGGSFNPPGKHVREIARLLGRGRNAFDQVILLPCGPRPDKAVTNDIAPLHRATMLDMTCRGLPRTRVELFDLEQSTFTHTCELEQRFASEGEIWHVIDIVFVQGGRNGRSVIQREWDKGSDLWRHSRFVFFAYKGDVYDPQDLPPHSVILDLPPHLQRDKIRDRIVAQQPFEYLVLPEVAAYIKRHCLYGNLMPQVMTRLSLSNPRAMLIVDERNPKALVLAAFFKHLAVDRDPNCILVFGGDGMMLHAIQKYWRRRLPFIGINAGHYGALLNDPNDLPTSPEAFLGDLKAYQSPMFFVEFQDARGRLKTAYAFNDAWVEKTSTQAIWLQLAVDGEVKIPRLVSDAFLASTAAGYEGYARSMGGHPLSVGDQDYVIVASNPHQPLHWRSAYCARASRVEVTSLDPTSHKRPMRGVVDGRDLGRVKSMKVRVSRIAAAEIAFLPGRDMVRKMVVNAFPAF